MWGVCVLVFWAVAAGVVTAGLLSSFYSLLTAERVSFRLLMTGGLAVSIVSLPLLLLSGPLVIARNAQLAGLVAARAWSWVAATAAIVIVWSFINGVVVLEFLLSLRDTLR
jgi:hypothetical protein